MATVGNVTHRYLISLDDPTCTNPDVAGSKAATLAQLKQAGFDVPEGMVLTATAFEDSVGDATEASIAAASLSASVEQALLSVSNRFGMHRQRLFVRSSLIEASGQPLVLGSPKTSASERTITLPHIAINPLTQHLENYPTTDGTVWTTEAGGFLRRGTFGRIWRSAVAESVGAPCRIHDLHHTHASWLIAAGEHPKSIQTRLGHSSIQVTIDRYGRLMDGLDERTAARLDAIAAAVRDRSTTPEPPGRSL